jgi:hypothetical protein
MLDCWASALTHLWLSAQAPTDKVVPVVGELLGMCVDLQLGALTWTPRDRRRQSWTGCCTEAEVPVSARAGRQPLWRPCCGTGRSTSCTDALTGPSAMSDPTTHLPPSLLSFTPYSLSSATYHDQWQPLVMFDRLLTSATVIGGL